MATRTSPGVASGRSLNGLAALVFGTVFVLIGLAGFFVSGGHHPVGAEGGDLLGLFQVNVAHNLVHLAVGAAMIVAGILGPRPARLVNTAFGGVYLLLAVVGLVIIGTSLNVIALNGADNALHLVLGIVLTAIGLRADRA